VRFACFAWQVGDIDLACVGGLDARVVGHLYNNAVVGWLAMLGIVVDL
jgi:hypothetical protein